MSITVGELKQELSVFSDDCELDFGELDFYRLTDRGSKCVQVEFDQMIIKDSKTGKIEVHNLIVDID